MRQTQQGEDAVPGPAGQVTLVTVTWGVCVTPWGSDTSDS